MSELLARLKRLPFYAANNLQINKKLGGLTDLKYEPLQLRMLANAVEQCELADSVNLVVVKPRQIKSSTLWLSLFYEEMITMGGTQCLVVANHSSVTGELFRTVKRFHDYLPRNLWTKPRKDNEEQLYLENESFMRIATIGSDGARGFPCSKKLGSEVGRYTTAQVTDYTEGACQTLARGAGSISIDESTSGGSGNYFHDIAKIGWDEHRKCTNKNERLWTLFFGAHEFPEYRLTPPKDWEMTQEEKALASEYNLPIDFMYWRYDRIRTEFRGSVTAFNREYPITFDLAFESAGGRLYNHLAILKARTSTISPKPAFPAIMGVDPASGKDGGDGTGVCIRVGDVVTHIDEWHGYTETEQATRIYRMIVDYEIHSCFIDMGYGHTIVTILRDLGLHNVQGVHFGERASVPELYYNRRSEMAGESKKWLEQGEREEGGLVRIPDDREFIQQLQAMPELYFISAKRLFALPSKEEIKEVLRKSPNKADAFFLTFAYPIVGTKERQLIRRHVDQQNKSILTTNNIFAELQEEVKSDKINPNFRYYSVGPKE